MSFICEYQFLLIATTTGLQITKGSPFFDASWVRIVHKRDISKHRSRILCRHRRHVMICTHFLSFVIIWHGVDFDWIHKWCWVERQWVLNRNWMKWHDTDKKLVFMLASFLLPCLIFTRFFVFIWYYYVRKASQNLFAII